MNQQHCFLHPDPRAIPTVPPHIAVFFSPIKGTYYDRVNGSQQELRAFSGSPIGVFGRRFPPFVPNMIMAQQQPNAEQNEECTRQSRSPSVDSISRLHQQSGGFASHNQQPIQQNSQNQSEQRHGSFTKDGNGGFYQHNQNNGGYRRQSFNQRGNRSNNQRSGNNYQQNGEYAGSNYQSGFQQKQQRNYQNTPQHYSKYSNFFQQTRPIFNSTQESALGSFSVRRPSPSSPSSPTPSTGNSNSNRTTAPAPVLLRHVDMPHNEKPFRKSESEQETHHDSKIHQYRSAGTAPGGYSNSSSPYKQPPPQPPSTPSSSEKRGDAEDWPSRYPHPPPGLQNQYRRGHHENMPAPIELQRKNPVPSIPIEITPNSQPTTPSSFERNAQFRAALKDPHSVDSVDAKHPCFADERMHSALYG